MADQFSKESDTELGIESTVKTVISKDKINGLIAQNRKLKQLLDDSQAKCDIEYQTLQAQLKQADDLGIKTADELAADNANAQQQLGQSESIK